MNNFLISLVGFVVAISVLVAIHEFGHFWVARRLGIKVLRFSIGFGKPIWRRQAADGDTEFVVSNLPLGGYVKMLDERDGDVAPAERHRAFNRQPVPSRIAVLVAGPAFNFLFAIFAYAVIFMAGVNIVKPVIGDITAGGIAAEAGLRVDDQIISVDGKVTPGWKDVQIEMLQSMVDDGRIRLQVSGADGAERPVTLEVGSEAMQLTEPGKMLPGLGLRGWSPPFQSAVGRLLEGGAAERAGLETGDQIRSVAGHGVADWNELVAQISSRPGETVEIEIQRDGQTRRVTATIGAEEVNGVQTGRLGIGPLVGDDIDINQLYVDAGMVTRLRRGPVAALGAAAVETWEMSTLTLKLFGKMITGQVSLKNISGPINIAQIAGYTATLGGLAFLGFLAIVSISLGILNLLPIPMLDGGQIVYQIAEWVKGSPLSARTEFLGQQLGIMLLLVLMGFAFYNDIVRLAG